MVGLATVVSAKVLITYPSSTCTASAQHDSVCGLPWQFKEPLWLLQRRFHSCATCSCKALQVKRHHWAGMGPYLNEIVLFLCPLRFCFRRAPLHSSALAEVQRASSQAQLGHPLRPSTY